MWNSLISQENPLYLHTHMTIIGYTQEMIITTSHVNKSSSKSIIPHTSLFLLAVMEHSILVVYDLAVLKYITLVS